MGEMFSARKSQPKHNSVRSYYSNNSQAARQGLPVLMASAVVVLKHETSNLRQSHNFISIDLTFGVRDYDQPCQIWFDRDATWGQHIRVMASRRPLYAFQLTRLYY